MKNQFSPELDYSIRRFAAEKRFELESKLSRKQKFVGKIRTGILRLAGSLAVAIFSAGLAIFLVSILLNLIFHFSPV